MRGSAGLDAAWLVLACGLALLHALHFRGLHHMSDDAFIVFRYVENFVAGRGLVFNPGEYVMGYSDPAWVLLLCVLHPILSPPNAAGLLGTLFAWGTLVRLYVFLRRRHERTLPAVAALAVLVPSGIFALWMLGGLEGHLFAFAITCGVTSAMGLDAGSRSRDFARAGAWFALAAWTRPEGILYAGAAGAALVLRRATRTPRVALLVGVPGTAYAVLLIAAAVYYGDPLPNTYYAKVHGWSAELAARGSLLALRFASSHYYAPVWILCLWAGTACWRKSFAGAVPLAVILAFVAFFVRIGGDVLEFYRLWLTVLPMLALLLGESIAAIEASGQRSLRPFAIGATAILAALWLPASFTGPDLNQVRRDYRLIRDLEVIGEALSREPEGTVVAANNIGLLAYRSDRRVIDMLGLTDRHIAKRGHKQIHIPGHESFDAAYVLDRAPDLIFVGLPQARRKPVRGPVDVSGGYPSDLALARDPRFLERYQVDNLVLADGRFAAVMRRRPALRDEPSR